jgi:putative addiction module component (TIGR02574 family)
MAQPLPFPPPGFDDLSTEEKLEYVQNLWDRIAAEPDDLPVPDWHWQILEQRLKAHRAHPEQVVSWEEAEREILSQLRDRSSKQDDSFRRSSIVPLSFAQ